tara:strand:- start:6978 stop:7397 length:420 start_codon:yes stop_codon:yes gene_type:complete
VNGPNLNLLGSRELSIYGNQTLLDIELWLNNQPESLKHKIVWFQSNHEGIIIEKLHDSIGKINGIIINPGALTHYSYAIRDAISSIKIPVVEVHLSDVEKREDFRKISVIKDVCIGRFYGLGKLVYLEALKLLAEGQLT